MEEKELQGRSPRRHSEVGSVKRSRASKFRGVQKAQFRLKGAWVTQVKGLKGTEGHGLGFGGLGGLQE